MYQGPDMLYLIGVNNELGRLVCANVFIIFICKISSQFRPMGASLGRWVSAFEAFAVLWVVLSAQRGWIHLPSSGHRGLWTWEGFTHCSVYAVLWELTENHYGELLPLWYMQEATAHTDTGQWPILRTLCDLRKPLPSSWRRGSSIWLAW